MDSAALTLAFTAGRLAALNPCGFALLPAYLSLIVLPGSSEDRAEGGGAAVVRRSAVSVGRAAAATVTMTLGFVLVFGAFGLLVQPVASGVQEYLPYLTAVTGVLLAGTGVALLARLDLRLPALHLRRAAGRGAIATFTYGVVYALASLTCTVGPSTFLAAVVRRCGTTPPARSLA